MEVYTPPNLWVNQIFKSISGEVGGFPQGSICSFLRLSGCNLKCGFCDAKETQTRKNGKKMNLQTIITVFENMKTKKVVITGGEPLIQKQALLELIPALLDLRYEVSIETNGTLRVPETILKCIKVTIVMDYKLDIPDKMDLHNFVELRDTDFIKFVIGSPDDLEKAIQIQKRLFVSGCCAQFAYSPMLPDLNSVKIFEFIDILQFNSAMILTKISESTLPAILNIQLHKIVGAD